MSNEDFSLIVSNGRTMKFHYTNYRGEDHEYVVEPESVAFGHYTPQGLDMKEPAVWVLHAKMVARDGASRPVGRRTFLLSGIRR